MNLLSKQQLVVPLLAVVPALVFVQYGRPENEKFSAEFLTVVFAVSTLAIFVVASREPEKLRDFEGSHECGDQDALKKAVQPASSSVWRYALKKAIRPAPSSL
jgi:hypothetical protein